MTTYTDHADALFDPGKPILGATGLEARDNAISVAEGGSNAPVLAAGWHPYDMVKVGDGNDGVIWDFAVDGALASIASPAFADGYEYALFFEAIEFSAAPVLTIDLRKEVDAAYETCYTSNPSTMATGTPYYGLVRVMWPRIPKFGHSVVWEMPMTRPAAVDIASGTFADMLDSTLQAVNMVRLTVNAGTVNAGKVKLLRRREFETG